MSLSYLYIINSQSFEEEGGSIELFELPVLISLGARGKAS